MLNIVKICCMPLVHDCVHAFNYLICKIYVPVNYLFQVDLNKLLKYVCVCACFCDIYEDTNLHNDMGMT